MNFISNGAITPQFINHDKAYRVMKLTFIMLFISVSGLFASVQSQTARVNIQATNANTKTIINEIEKQTDYLFVYDANDIDMNRPASIQVVNETVASVLTSLFHNTNVVYAMEGNNIFLMKRGQSAAVAQQNGRKVTGKLWINEENRLLVPMW